MVRKMAYVGLSYIAGLFFASFFSVQNNICFIVGLVLIMVAYIFFIKNRKIEFIVIITTFCIAILMNIAYTKLVYENIIKYDNQQVAIKGEIIDIKELNDDKAFYTIEGEINGKEKAKIIVYTDAVKCDYYDKIEMQAMVNELQNDLSFPSKDYYKAKNIYLEADNVTYISVSGNNHSIKRGILHYRDYIYNRIVTILPGDEGAFLGALLCGDKSSLNTSTKTTLYRAGIGHIMAVSGTHLMIIAGLLLWILMKFKMNKWLRFFIVEGVILGFIVFAGLSNSVIRAGIMFTILMLGTIAKRRADALNSIGIAGLVLTITTPFAIRDASLLLSLAGVFGIAVFAPFVLKTLNLKGKFISLKNSFITMICVLISTFPFVLLFFDEMSLISPISNIILVPLCVFALICGLVVAIFGGVSFIAYPLLIVAGIALKFVLLLAKMLIKIPCAYLPLGYSFIPLTLGLCLIGIVIITYMFKTKKALLSSILSSVMVMLIAVSIFQFSYNGKLKIAILTQNNSTAMVLYKDGQASIIDLEGKGQISDVVEKYLVKKGIKKVDLLVLTQNSQKAVSSYLNDISESVNKICNTDNERMILSDNIINNISAGDIVSVNDYQINFTQDYNYIIKFYNFNLQYDVKNDKILFNSENNCMELNNYKSATGEAFLIVANTDGDYDIRRMSYALRE